MSWSEAAKETESIFLKWDGGPYHIRFIGEPVIEHKHFVQGRPADCDGAGCPHCAMDIKLDTAFVFDVTVYAVTGGGEPTPRKFSLSKRAMKELLAVRDRIGDKFEKALLRCARSGAGQNIKYRFDVVGQWEGAESDLPL